MIKGRYALVTGSTSGIGLAIAKILASNGCNIALNGFASDDEISKLTNNIESEYQVKVIYCGADLTKEEEIIKMVGEIKKKFGKIDILVNNAGIQYVAEVENFPTEKWDQIISLNLSSVFHLSKAILPIMKQNKWGRIINIASTHGKVASMKKSAYVAAKHGVVGLTKVIALENASNGITCNSICPGWVLTPLVQKQIDAIASQENISQEEAKKKLLLEKQPAGEFVKPEDIGNFVVFLCSDSANIITGSNMSIDGGWTAQ